MHSSCSSATPCQHTQAASVLPRNLGTHTTWTRRVTRAPSTPWPSSNPSTVLPRTTPGPCTSRWEPSVSICWRLMLCYGVQGCSVAEVTLYSGLKAEAFTSVYLGEGYCNWNTCEQNFLGYTLCFVTSWFFRMMRDSSRARTWSGEAHKSLLQRKIVSFRK